MAKWNDKKNWSTAFYMEVSEETKAFFERMDKEAKEREDAIRERIQQLFDEYIKVDGEKRDEAYCQIRQVFAIGYQLGWNDHYSLFNNKEVK